MKAFHGKKKIKDEHVQRMKDHIAAELIRGITYDNNRRCPIGCTLDGYDHERYETELGIPEWLAILEETLFEGMSPEKSKTFRLIFLESIMPEVELDNIKVPFLIIILDSLLYKFDHNKFPDVLTCINNVRELYVNNEEDRQKFRDADNAAKRAFQSAHRASEAAYRNAEASAYDVEAASAASWESEAARAASWAASAASWSAAAFSWPAWAASAASWAAAPAGDTYWASWSADFSLSSQYDYFADQLIELIENCK